MKKLISIIMVIGCVFYLTGCEKAIPKQGNYNKGTYMGSSVFESYGKKYVTTAVLYVDNNGLIQSCFIDSTYIKDDVNTTKKVLGDNYGMKETSKNKGVIPNGAEWYEQIAVIEDKVVKEQGLDWVTWSDTEQTKLDGISGVTITADTYINAIRKALEQAK